MFKNFSEAEIMNPLFDSCPGSKFTDLPAKVQENLFRTMSLVQKIRDHTGLKMRINSTYRPGDTWGPHRLGKAVDFQFMEGIIGSYLTTMNWLQNDDSISGFRALLEWNGLDPWIHVDTNYHLLGRKKVLLVGYPKGGVRNNKMIYEKYRGLLPKEHVNG